MKCLEHFCTTYGEEQQERLGRRDPGDSTRGVLFQLILFIVILEDADTFVMLTNHATLRSRLVLTVDPAKLLNTAQNPLTTTS